MVGSSQKLSCGRTTGCHLWLPKVQVYFITSWIAGRSNNRSKQDKSIEKHKQGKNRPIHQMYNDMTLAELLRTKCTKYVIPILRSFGSLPLSHLACSNKRQLTLRKYYWFDCTDTLGGDCKTELDNELRLSCCHFKIELRNRHIELNWINIGHKLSWIITLPCSVELL